MFSVRPHPLLELRAFISEFPRPLGALVTAHNLLQLLRRDAAAPLQSNDEVRRAIRDMLRHDGFKPTGRSKPASEYLLRAAGQASLSSINVAVDACNAVSLHSGLPISVVDLDCVREPLHVDQAPQDASYIFNASGQSIDVSHLLCLFDADGPCANAVKDSQRTKTGAETRRTLSVIWSSIKLPGRVSQAESWYRELLKSHGATTQRVEPQG